MNRMPIARKHFWVWTLSILLCLSGLTGCRTLKRKFTRKKDKDKKEKFVPVLEPIDYEQQQASPEETYAYHYSMWKVYHGELQASLKEGNDKRNEYAVEQIIVQLNHMRELLTEESRARLDDYLMKYQKIKKDLDRPEALRSIPRIQRKLLSYGNDIRDQFNEAAVSEGIVRADGPFSGE